LSVAAALAILNEVLSLQRMTMEVTTSRSAARGILESISDHKLVLAIPGTDYKLHLVPTVPASSIATPLGKRIKGTIDANALRIFHSTGGGRFIEPIWGEPRIIAGYVTDVDEVRRRLLVDVAVPIWLTLDPRQSTNNFKPGDLVNCYVQSGATFTPATG
jgi:hypothetical protein